MIDHCRLCASSDLISVINLGKMSLTGHFPRPEDVASVPSGSLNLCWCKNCNLLQLADSIPPQLMYGDNYGYRSGLNPTMVKHLSSKVSKLMKLFQHINKPLNVLDIGSNDGTLLGQYPDEFVRVGIDPTISKFHSFYKPDIITIPEFFDFSTLIEASAPLAYDIITSIAMFYDLESPVTFAKDIKSILSPHGVWHFEQSYLPCMLRTNSYDTICHEHLEYYSLANISAILEMADMKLVDVTINSINGGSFAVTVSHKDSPYTTSPICSWLTNHERTLDFTSPSVFRDFEANAYSHAKELKSLIQTITASGQSVYGYGASTKGNVILQLADLSPDLIKGIADVNSLKEGAFTPGTNIPIHSENHIFNLEPDYLLVLPWHFRDFIISKESAFLARGGKLIFPLPYIEIVG
jgi:hypothetical protein